MFPSFVLSTACTQVRHVMLGLELGAVSATPVFVPVYVFKTRIRGTVMRTYVAGGFQGHPCARVHMRVCVCLWGQKGTGKLPWRVAVRSGRVGRPHTVDTGYADAATTPPPAGFTQGLSSGPVLPNPTRVAALTAAAAPVALAAGGLFDWLPLPVALVVGMVMPAMVGYLAARWVAVWRKMWTAQIQQAAPRDAD